MAMEMTMQALACGCSCFPDAGMTLTLKTGCVAVVPGLSLGVTQLVLAGALTTWRIASSDRGGDDHAEHQDGARRLLFRHDGPERSGAGERHRGGCGSGSCVIAGPWRWCLYA